MKWSNQDLVSRYQYEFAQVIDILNYIQSQTIFYEDVFNLAKRKENW